MIGTDFCRVAELLRQVFCRQNRNGVQNARSKNRVQKTLKTALSGQDSTVQGLHPAPGHQPWILNRSRVCQFGLRLILGDIFFLPHWSKPAPVLTLSKLNPIFSKCKPLCNGLGSRERRTVENDKPPAADGIWLWGPSFSVAPWELLDQTTWW